jgi:hypothetical protein
MLQEEAPLVQLRQFAAIPLAFRCRPAGRKDATERFLARVGHYLHSPASPVELSQLKEQLGACSTDLANCYVRHNGFVLYRDTLSDTAGVEVLPVRGWAKATERWQQQVQDRMDDEQDEQLAPLLSCMVFGLVPRSGNFFTIQTSGPESGHIFCTDHETMALEQFAPDFGKFVVRIISNPVRLLAKELGCFARYSDGVSSTQWIPEEAIVGGGEA